jgi:small subunit ribosomal protein S20
MANHKSAEKAIRSSEAKRLRNKYQLKTTRTYIKKLKTTTNKTDAQDLLKTVVGMIDKLVKNNIIKKNNASHKKSQLAIYVNSLN